MHLSIHISSLSSIIWLRQLQWLCHSVCSFSVCINFGPQTDKQIELSLFHAPFQVSVCVSEWVRAASWLWATYVRGGPVSPVSTALPSQPATTVGPQCARGISDPTLLHAPGHRSFCRLPLRRPDSQSHISHKITNNRALLKCLSSRLQHESIYQFWQLQAWKLRTQRFTPPTKHI